MGFPVKPCCDVMRWSYINVRSKAAGSEASLVYRTTQNKKNEK